MVCHFIEHHLSMNGDGGRLARGCYQNVRRHIPWRNRSSDAVATVGGAMDDVTARRDVAGSAELEVGNTSAPSSMRR